jgi:hypothetical protein
MSVNGVLQQDHQQLKIIVYKMIKLDKDISMLTDPGKWLGQESQR